MCVDVGMPGAAEPSSPPPAGGLIVFGASSPAIPTSLQRSRSADLGSLRSGQASWAADSSDTHPLSATVLAAGRAKSADLSQLIKGGKEVPRTAGGSRQNLLHR